MFKNKPDSFDLIISDQIMPGMTGSELSVKMLGIRPDIPIILCTGNNTLLFNKKVKSIGVRECIQKPVQKNDIARIIRKVLD